MFIIVPVVFLHAVPRMQDGQAAEQQGQVGCLMEVTRAVRLEDGKLLMLATVLGR